MLIYFLTNYARLNTATEYDNDVICIENNNDLKNVEDNLADKRQYRAEVVIKIIFKFLLIIYVFKFYH